MKIGLTKLANQCGGALFGEDRQMDCLVSDSRKVKNGCIFAAIKGERVDGFDFIESLDEQFENIAYLCDRPLRGVRNPFIITEDVISAVGAAAAVYIQSAPLKKIAVTGSVGKTTTKDFIAAALGSCMSVHFSKANNNNELGLPLTVFGIKDYHKSAVFEMGMRGTGQIRYLADIVRPDIGVITNIGLSHIELLGSKENIKNAKLELVDRLTPNGFAVLNGDDEMLWESRSNIARRSVYFGIENTNSDFAAINIKKTKGISFDIWYSGGVTHIELAVAGLHNIYNALAAFAVGTLLHCPPELLAEGIGKFTGDGVRQNIYEYKGITLFDDTYNASPASMIAAMDVLNGFDGPKTLVLADMLELGDYSEAAHRQVGQRAADLEPEHIICIGDKAAYIYDEVHDRTDAHLCADNQSALEILLKISKTGDNILFKGSNSMNLDKLVEMFKAGYK